MFAKNVFGSHLKSIICKTKIRACARLPVACSPLSVADRHKRPQGAGLPCALRLRAHAVGYYH